MQYQLNASVCLSLATSPLVQTYLFQECFTRSVFSLSGFRQVTGYNIPLLNRFKSFPGKVAGLLRLNRSYGQFVMHRAVVMIPEH